MKNLMTIEDKKSLGREIKMKRLERNLEQNDVASLLGVNQRTVSGWETGTIAPHIKYFLHFPNIFKCSLDDLNPLCKKNGGSRYENQSI